MKVSIVCVGRPKGALSEAIKEYEGRIGHYFGFDATEVKAATHRGQSIEQVIAEEGERLLARIPNHHELIGLHRSGKPWSSEALARRLAEASLRSAPGITFAIGGAYGLAPGILTRADHLMSLSAMTLPHDMARLVLAEQLYRAGTIIKGEPYHKGTSR
ncbi:MAG: 23S rRNA (pseudouridine(1915)-N(3))-methyltransferase RlmH [Gemmatimonadota bacterium]